MNVIQFLTDAWNKVVAWFGDKFWTLYNGALKAWDWAVDRANKAYNDAINWAWYYIRGLQSDLSAVIDWVDDELGRVIQNARDAAVDAMGGFAAWASDWINYLRSQVAGLSTTVSNLYNQTVASLSAWVNSQIDTVRRFVADNYGWVLALKAQLVALVSSLTPPRIAAIIDLIDRRAAQIATFFDDPLTFILDMLRPVVVTFLSFVLAYALGSTKHDLPPFPKWKDK